MSRRECHPATPSLQLRHPNPLNKPWHPPTLPASSSSDVKFVRPLPSSLPEPSHNNTASCSLNTPSTCDQSMHLFGRNGQTQKPTSVKSTGSVAAVLGPLVRMGSTLWGMFTQFHTEQTVRPTHPAGGITLF